MVIGSGLIAKSFSKNKLFVKYLTVPVKLNFNLIDKF